jgi:hypothetical protein
VAPAFPPLNLNLSAKSAAESNGNSGGKQGDVGGKFSGNSYAINTGQGGKAQATAGFPTQTVMLIGAGLAALWIAKKR